jgi:hypothetical protein
MSFLNESFVHESIDYELRHGCYRRPTKRKALRVAQILSQERVHPADLNRTLWILEELKERIRQAKV